MMSMTEGERVRYIRRVLWFFTLIPGIVMLLFYKIILTIPTLSCLSFSLIKAKDILSPIIASYAITSLGFIGAVVAFSVTLPQNYKVKRYKGMGQFNNYLLMVKIDIVYLIIDLVLSILLLANSQYAHYILNAMMVFFVDTLLISFLSVYILINLMKKEKPC